MKAPHQPRATIIGTGLIGASVGFALREIGWHVCGDDSAPGLVESAIAIGACDDIGLDPTSDLVVIATPVPRIVEQAQRALAQCQNAVVSDVGGVKASIVNAISDPRFLGGHPMAGSEQLGLEGADGNIFHGAAWVLCPSRTTSDQAFAFVRSLVVDLGAQALTMEAVQHDALVAVVSHVPHLTAAALVQVAGRKAEQHRALLRLAAGGFRDMTRIAAGNPNIWPGVCAQNRDAILSTLDELTHELQHLRNCIANGDSEALSATLHEAQLVRQNLPTQGPRDVSRCEVRVRIPDEPGALAAVAALATEFGINLESVATIDVAAGAGGVAILGVREDDANALCAALTDARYRVTMQPESAT